VASYADSIPQVNEEGRRRRLVAWVLIATLLLIRGPFMVTVRLSTDPAPIWLEPAFQIGTYVLTALFVLWERDSLATFHIDGLALVIIIAAPPLSTVLLSLGGASNWPMAFPHWPSLVIWAVALAFLASLSRYKPTVRSSYARSLGWFGLGIAAGVVASIAVRLAVTLTAGTALQFAATGPVLLSVLQFLPYQVGYAGVSEEPLFRGFLWGQLRRSGWRDVWIWSLQAAAFGLVHLYMLLRAPLAFWSLVAPVALVGGLLVWRSRSLCSSMAAHAAINSIYGTVGLGLG
jgi:membrane protease YdiL (CAAX protease family)